MKKRFLGSPRLWRMSFQRLMNAVSGQPYQRLFGWGELTAWSNFLGVTPVEYDGWVYFDVIESIHP